MSSESRGVIICEDVFVSMVGVIPASQQRPLDSPTLITLKLEQWETIRFDYTAVYKNDVTKVDVVPIGVILKRLAGVSSSPTEIEWSATQQNKMTSVELELFAASAVDFSMDASFPKFTVDADPFYRGILSPSKLRVTADDMAMYWIRSDNEKLDFAISVRTNVKIRVDSEWRHKITGPDQRQTQRSYKNITGFAVGGKGALFSVHAPSTIEILFLPGNSQTGFRSQTKEILAAVKSNELIKFETQSPLPNVSVQPIAVKSPTGAVNNVYPMILARLKSTGQITLTFWTPTLQFIFDTPSFDLDVFGVKTVVRHISVTKPQGEMQLGSQSYRLSEDIFIDGPGLAFADPTSAKLVLKGAANFVAVEAVQLIPTIAQSIGKEIWAGVVGGLLGSIGSLIAVWWPKKNRR